MCAPSAGLRGDSITKDAATVVAAPGMRECGVVGEGEDKQGHRAGKGNYRGEVGQDKSIWAGKGNRGEVGEGNGHA